VISGISYDFAWAGPVWVEGHRELPGPVFNPSPPFVPVSVSEGIFLSNKRKPD